MHEVAPGTRNPLHAVPNGMIVHEPSSRQHTCPCGGQGLGVQVLPVAGVVPGGQALPAKKKQTFRSQHARKHGLGLHVVTPVSTVPLHALGVVTSVQLPSGRQHTKPGRHGLGEQVLPGAGVLVDGHGPFATKHVPSGRQHACGHGLGWHEPAGMNDTAGGTRHCDHGAI